jgi:quinol monooxygenase YgiN
MSLIHQFHPIPAPSRRICQGLASASPPSPSNEQKGGFAMVKFALYGSLKAKPGKEAEVEAFLKQGAELAKKEKGTVTWYAIKEDHGQYGIFDTFNDEAGREAHLNGEIAKALMAKAGELLAEPPKIHKIDVLAQK